ncbi:hypothetical protein FBEOM_855 [Fusarium beomiforme]|uniref:CHAT domain-containing protein n=1 Tax=Fusarium beomiforme TaxID=44412 RepID=A0A9P5E5B5_9HYPO|nr:hypothetical protein FBEOM_855 [Fusarium beomiforme]
MSDDSGKTLTLDELERAIANLRDSLESLSRDNLEFYSKSTLLAHALRKRYLLSRLPKDLDVLVESISLLKEVLHSIPPGDVRRPEWLISLAFGLSLRCDATEVKEDAIEASRAAFEAVNAVQKDDPAYATILESACHFITKKAIRLHDEDDLEKVVDMHKSIIAITPSDHPQYISRLRAYDSALFKGYLEFGYKAALKESIRVSQYIVSDLEEKQNPEEHAKNMSILGRRLVERYLRTGISADLNESINTCQQAVNSTPISSKSRHRRLQSLCDRLGEKYSQTLDEADFQAAKKVLDEILDHLPAKPKSRARSLGNIGIILSLRYRQTGREDDFERAVSIGQQSVDITAPGDIGRAIRLSNLGGIFDEAYGKTANKERLEESIHIGRDALAATPDGHPDRALRHFILANRLSLRYHELNMAEDLEEAISFYRLTLDHSGASVFLRVQAGHLLMQSCMSKRNLKEGDMKEAYRAGSKTIIILAEFRPRSLHNADIQREVGKLAGLATEVASISLILGRTPVDALELLEMARGVMASSINVLRADIQELEEKLPDLASKYNRLRDQLDMASAKEVELQLDWGSELSLRYNAGEEFSSLLEEIRSQPGFKSFLRAEDEERMRSSAALGPVVVVNVSHYLCVAIIIKQDGFRAIPLPALKKSDIDLKHSIMGRGSLKVLEWLWDVVAGPILNALDITEPAPEGDMKRVWWVLTDSLSTFPIHAAGYERKRRNSHG